MPADAQPNPNARPGAQHRSAHRLAVDLGERSYHIHIGAGILPSLGALLIERLPDTRTAVVVADATVANLHGEAVLASLRAAGVNAVLATFAPGEESKSLSTTERLWKACADAKLGRDGVVVGLGGGVAGDMAGFVAACWMRGVAFVQIPTTLLAMVDSSVGGKTGVNSAAGKNLIGAFKQPSLVLADTSTLATMSDREYRAGLAEVAKYGVIYDAEFFTWQERHASALLARDAAAVAHAVERSCAIKAWYVAKDEFEQNVRAHLNYGHTFGHAIERETKYAQYLHGEAVAIGMGMAADLAARLGLCSDSTLIPRQRALLRAYQLPVTHSAADPTAEVERLLGAVSLDKKALGGQVRFVLPTRLGAVEVVAVSDREKVREAFAGGVERG